MRRAWADNISISFTVASVSSQSSTGKIDVCNENEGQKPIGGSWRGVLLTKPESIFDAFYVGLSKRSHSSSV